MGKRVFMAQSGGQSFHESVKVRGTHRATVINGGDAIIAELNDVDVMEMSWLFLGQEVP